MISNSHHDQADPVQGIGEYVYNKSHNIKRVVISRITKTSCEAEFSRPTQFLMWLKVTSEKKTSIKITSNQDKESHQGSQTLRMSLQNLRYWIAHRWGSARQLTYPTSTFDHGDVTESAGLSF
jgi:hypothetical protein